MKKSKKYVAALAKVDATKLYTIEEAVKLVKETSTVKFDATVDVSFKLNVDPKQADFAPAKPQNTERWVSG